jgi:hypothetical protein
VCEIFNGKKIMNGLIKIGVEVRIFKHPQEILRLNVGKKRKKEGRNEKKNGEDKKENWNNERELISSVVEK